MATKHTFKENVLRVVAVVGLIAVLLLGAWGIIQLAFFLPGFLSGLAGGPAKQVAAETLTVSIPMGVNSENTFPISWSHKNATGQYSYTVSYACAEGLSMKTILPTGAMQTVPCNTPFNYTNATTSVPVTATVTGTNNVVANFTVSATKLSSGSVTATGSGSTTIAPAKAATTVKPATTQKPSTTYVASTKRANLYGYGDLQVRILSNPGSVRVGQQVNLQFSIENTGTNVVPANWIFTASLPYQGGYTYQSPSQQALYPGDKIVYTLGYSAQAIQDTNYNPCTGWTYPCTNPNPVYGGPGTCNMYGPCNVPGYPANIYGYSYPAPNYGGVANAEVRADPYNLVWEFNESNNTAAISYQVY